MLRTRASSISSLSSSLSRMISSIIASASSRSRSSAPSESKCFEISASEGRSVRSSFMSDSKMNSRNLSSWPYSITSSPSIALRTAVNIFLACAALSVLGAPRRNSATLSSLARARILLADIPDTSSASGSRSPADLTSIFSNVYSLPLYVLSSFVKLSTRSEPTNIVIVLNPSRSSSFRMSMTFRAFDLRTIAPNAARANVIFLSYGRGSFLPVVCER